MADDKQIPVGSDGNPMSRWQVRLRILCYVLVGWGVVEAFAAIAAPLIAPDAVGAYFSQLPIEDPLLVFTIVVVLGAILNIVVALLGVRGARDPRKITLFFWIAVVDGVLCAWQMASDVARGSFDAATALTGTFVIALAVCAWMVRGQTGYFDNTERIRHECERELERERKEDKAVDAQGPLT